ncbi:Glycoprotein elicitor [Phytophthora megakarya]|uniref:Glycoprotein elicitor n=1 Tax=Phytophthora megakarya TaxID=4795 RepID=A0A225VDA4_9STRA|nr:Glycoprotein elicitor [Phytophthora megakarya]
MRPTRYFSTLFVANVATLAALLLPGATGTPFANNPVTIVQSATSLSHSSPAFGGIAPGTDLSVLTYQVHEYKITTFQSSNSSSTTSSTTTTNNEVNEATSDLQKLQNHFGGAALEYNLHKLASEAAYYVMPWPSSYWAMYLDSINYRWKSPSDPSPAEKYANAFGIDPAAFMSSVSKSTGVDSMAASGSSCWTDWDCASKALLEPEPNCAVDYNGVTFYPMDIKALLSEIYDGAKITTIFTGARFYGPDTDESKDEYGRYKDASRRDLGPGFMHVALSNIIGRFKASVVMDVTAGAQVWNQPIYSYKVLTQTEMTLSDAANQFFRVSTYPFNNEAKRIMYVETSVSWMVETFEDGGLVASGRASTYMNSKTYKYLLEMDNDYNILGGEWVGESQADHPDFLWLPKARPDLSLVTEVGLSYQNVRTLLDKATNCS